MEFGAATHPGYVRGENEDGFFASGDLAVFAVADGMGGHQHGELASHLALEAITRQAEKLSHASPTELPVMLHQAMQDANAAIYAQAAEQNATDRMGTTLVLATIYGDRLYFAHIGDSRLYLLRGDVFTQLTRDHSLVQSLVDRGEISADEAAIHPLRHQITRVVGGDSYISPEIASQALEPGDLIVLCTDGLSGTVPQDTIKSTLQNSATVQEKADALVQAALAMGGPDNVTVVVTAFERPRVASSDGSSAAQSRRLPFWQTLFISSLVLLILAIGTGLWAYTHPQYYISVDSRGMLVLYKHWPLLYTLPPERIAIPEAIPVSYDDAKSDLMRYGAIERGIRLQNEDAGVMLLQDIAQSTAARLCEEAKRSAELGRFAEARGTLNRAKVMGADPDHIEQLSVLIDTAEAQQPLPPPAP
jgi:protein phosphatase